jgi:metallophosphoesterase (TIGR00282 family)
MRILFLGDCVGKAGRMSIQRYLPNLKEKYRFDCIILNGENAAGGFGITEQICNDFFHLGVHCITLGNHAWDQKDIFKFIDSEIRVIRPANYPKGTIGRGATVLSLPTGYMIMVINLMGRVFMDPLDCPFAVVDDLIEKTPMGQVVDAIIIDIHAEANSEKMAMAHYLDGRVSCVIGTHTHIPTADTMILDGGTGYQTDAGMCGDYNSVIGMQKEEPIHRFTTKINSSRYEPATGEATLCGVFIETDNKTGLTTQIAPIRLGGRLFSTKPD